MVIFLILMCVIGLSIIWWTIKNGISPMPTFPKAKAAFLSILPEEVHGNIYELGSGWGTLVFPLAEKFPSCQVTGFETSPFPFWISLLRAQWNRYPNIKLVRQDFFSTDLSKASLVVCYLYGGAMKKLQAKFEKELKPGTIIVTHTFAIPGWKCDKMLIVDDLYLTKVYLYRLHIGIQQDTKHNRGDDHIEKIP